MKAQKSYFSLVAKVMFSFCLVLASVMVFSFTKAPKAPTPLVKHVKNTKAKHFKDVYYFALPGGLYVKGVAGALSAYPANCSPGTVSGTYTYPGGSPLMSTINVTYDGHSYQGTAQAFYTDPCMR